MDFNEIGMISWILFINFAGIMSIVNNFMESNLSMPQSCILGFVVGAFGVFSAPYWMTCYGITSAMILTNYCITP